MPNGSLRLAFALTFATSLPAQRASDTLSTFQQAKAVAMLRDRLSCLGCHAFGNDGGRLAPDLATVASRRSAAYIGAMIDDPQRVVPGNMMPRPIMLATTRDLIVRYLSRGASTTASPVPNGTPVARQEPSGAQLYATTCAGCHGARGEGDGPNASRLPVKPAVHASSREMSARTDDRLYDAIAAGGESLGRSPRMPAFGGTLAPAQIRSLVRHIRTLCACEGPGWSVR